MKRVRVSVACLAGVAVLLLGACDPQNIRELEEGVATETDVRARFGPPEQVWGGAGGVRIFEYNRQPEGHVNYMITIGTDGKMSALRQVLTPANFAKITPGTSMEDVRRSLGKPASVAPYPLKSEVHHNWRFVAPGERETKIFSVVLDSNLMVLRTEVGADMQSTANR